MVVAGLAGVAVGMGLAAWWSMRWTLHGAADRGLVFGASAALAGVGATLVLAGPTAALTVPTAGLIVGFALALRAGGDTPDGDGDDPDPPWWPSFERDLRRYERRSRVR